MKEKTFFFDLDGTLCRVNGSREKILDNCLLEFNLDEIDRYDYLRAHDSILSNNKVRDRAPVFKELLMMNGINDVELAEELASLYNERVLDDLELYEDAESLLSDFDDFNLVLITNGPELTQKQKIRELGIGDFFDEVIISGEVGFAKPNPLIFKIAQIRAGGKGPYIGNSPKHDVRGSKEAGFECVLVDRGIECSEEPDYVVDSLSELRDIYKI